MTENPRLELVNDWLKVKINPDRGACLEQFAFRGADGDSELDIFQNVAVAGPESWAYFAMVPYTARLYHGVFPWADKYFSVAPVRNSKHAIHGPGRQHRWFVSEVTNERVQLTLKSKDHPLTFAYPSQCEMTLTYEVRGNTLLVTWEITNVGDVPMPIGGGSHPFIPKLLAGCTNPPVLKFECLARYLPRMDTPGEAMPNGTTQLMTGSLSFANGRVPEEGWDHCLASWTGIATATWKDIGVQLVFEDLEPSTERFAHLWYAPDKPVWAFEQEIAIGNAFNLADDGVRTGMRTLVPGESTGFQHSFRVTRGQV